MSKNRPDHAHIAAAIERLDNAVAVSTAVRKRYRRRITPARNPALEQARQDCADSVPLLRSWLGMAAWGGIDVADELAMKNAVERARYERRQIDKMLK